MNETCVKIFKKNFSATLNVLLLLTVYVCAIVFILFSNILMIIGTIKLNKHLSLSKKLFLCQSFSDLVTGILTVPIQIGMVINGSKSNCTLVSIQAFFNAFSPSLSMMLLMVISLFRYALITKNSKAMKLTSPSAVKFILIIQVLISLCYACWYCYISRLTRQLHHVIFLIFSSVYVICIVTGMIVINLRLLFHINKTSKNSALRQNSNIVQYHTKATKTILIITVVAILCYLPLIVLFPFVGFLIVTNDPRSHYYNYMLPWAHAPIVYNSGINSIVYISRNGGVLKYIKMFFTKTVAQDNFSNDRNSCGRLSCPDK